MARLIAVPVLPLMRGVGGYVIPDGVQAEPLGVGAHIIPSGVQAEPLGVGGYVIPNG